MENHKRAAHHKHSSSQLSMESEVGGHEQLKTVLMDEDEQKEIMGENVKVTESTALIRESGGDGLYQKLAFLGFLVPALSVFFVIMLMSSMNDKPDLLCLQEDTNEYTACTIEAACSHGSKFIVNTQTSYINWLYDFDLLCETSSFLKIVYYFFFGGFFVGAMIVAPLADYMGRKSILLLSSVALCLAYLKFVFTEDVFSCAVVLCCIGVFVASYYCSTIAYLTEITSQESAVTYAIMFHLAFPLSGALVVAMMRWLRDWKILTTIMALIPLIIIAYITYLAESPRFLAAKKQYDSAKASANIISSCNTKQKHNWEFCPDSAECTPAYAAFSESRNQTLFQHSLFFSYSSTKRYLFAFSLLLLCTGFAFAGLAITQKQIFSNPFMDSLALYAVEFVMLLFACFFIKYLGHVKTIFLSLLATGAAGLVSTLLLWVNDFAHGLIAYVMKLFALMAFVASISLAAEACPPRVRATGFGISIGMGTIGLMCGGFVLEFHDNLHIVFGIVALCGIIFLPWISQLSAYAASDDIYEVTEMYKTASKKDALDIKIVLEKPQADTATYEVEGTKILDDEKIPLGIEAFSVSMKGEISYEGRDQNGSYSLSGLIKHENKVTIVKKYANGKETKYQGERIGNEILGTYEAGLERGKFELRIKAKVWVGEVPKDQEIKKLEWVIVQAKDQVYGLGKIDDVAYFLSGKMHAENKVKLSIMTERESETSFEGEIKEDSIKGIMSETPIILRPAAY